MRRSLAPRLFEHAVYDEVDTDALERHTVHQTRVESQVDDVGRLHLRVCAVHVDRERRRDRLRSGHRGRRDRRGRRLRDRFWDMHSATMRDRVTR